MLKINKRMVRKFNTEYVCHLYLMTIKAGKLKHNRESLKAAVKRNGVQDIALNYALLEYKKQLEKELIFFFDNFEAWKNKSSSRKEKKRFFDFKCLEMNLGNFLIFYFKHKNPTLKVKSDPNSALAQMRNQKAIKADAFLAAKMDYIQYAENSIKTYFDDLGSVHS